jgi:hypothetical protein
MNTKLYRSMNWISRFKKQNENERGKGIIGWRREKGGTALAYPSSMGRIAMQTPGILEQHCATCSRAVYNLWGTALAMLLNHGGNTWPQSPTDNVSGTAYYELRSVSAVKLWSQTDSVTVHRGVKILQLGLSLCRTREHNLQEQVAF